MTRIEADLAFEKLKPKITLRQIGEIAGFEPESPEEPSPEWDAILDSTLSELERRFGSAAGLDAFIARRLEAARIAQLALQFAAASDKRGEA